jgi:hypothetical protein
MTETRKRPTQAAFRGGDVYIDYPYEDVKFRFEKATGRVYRRWYRESEEMEIPYDSELYNDAHSRGWLITRDEYYSDWPVT